MNGLTNNLIDLAGLFSLDGIRIHISNMDEIRLNAREGTDMPGVVSRYDVGVDFTQPTFRKVFLQGMVITDEMCVRYLLRLPTRQLQPLGDESLTMREAEMLKVFNDLPEDEQENIRTQVRQEIESKLIGENPSWVIWVVALHIDHITLTCHDKDDMTNINMIDVCAENLTLKIRLQPHMVIGEKTGGTEQGAGTGKMDRETKRYQEHVPDGQSDRREPLTIDYAISGSGERGHTRTLLLRTYFGERQFSTMQYTIHAMELARRLKSC